MSRVEVGHCFVELSHYFFYKDTLCDCEGHAC